MKFTVIQGDIAEQQADALVNAAGTSLRMGSGVAGALKRAAGPELNDEAMSKGPVDLGDCAVTDAHDLDSTYVIHAAAMPHYGDGKATEASIRNATTNALSLADELECESLVIPALGCGVAGFRLEAGTELICEELSTFQPSSLRDVRLIGYSDEEFETIRTVARSIDAYQPSSQTDRAGSSE